MRANWVTVLKWFSLINCAFVFRMSFFSTPILEKPFDYLIFWIPNGKQLKKKLMIECFGFVCCQTGLRGVKRELLNALTKCQRVKACQEVLEEYEIGKLDMNGIDYDQVIFQWKWLAHKFQQQNTHKHNSNSNDQPIFFSLSIAIQMNGSRLRIIRGEIAPR